MGKNTPDRSQASTGIRLDKWLWCARLYKTRALAAHAIKTGKVEVKGARVKPAHAVAPGDRLRIRRGPFVHEVTIAAVAGTRRSATGAAALYTESAESIKACERIAARLEAGRARYPRPRGRPGKRDRRQLVRFKHRGDEQI